MGSTLGSVLQTIGQTGNEAAAGDIAGVNQQHQFLMDYLANKARERALDIQQTGQAGMLDIEKQRLAQSRWQMLPGYSKVPDPSDPSNTLYRHTFVDPITKQQSTFDTDQPPPGSTDYIMRQFKDFTKETQDLGLDIPLAARLSAAGMKIDTDEARNMAFKTKWDMMQNAAKDDPVARVKLNKLYPGGFVDYLSKQTETGPMTTEEWLDYVMKNNLSRTGQPVINPYQKLYEQSLVQSQRTFQALWKSASDTVDKFGEWGKVSRPTEYKSAVDAMNSAKDNLDRVNQQLNEFYRSANNPSGPTGPNQGSAITMTPSAAITRDMAMSRGATGAAPGSDGNWYWHDGSGNIIGPAPMGGQ